MSSKSKIILALDTNNFSKTEKLIKNISNEIFAVKIGYQFFYKFHLKAYNLLNKYKLKVFLDLKLHDIPNTVSMGIKNLNLIKSNMLTVHISGGLNMLKKAKKFSSKTQIIGVSILTSLAKEDLLEIYNTKDLKKLITKMTKIALKAKIDGIVCSPKEISIIKKIAGNKLKIITPGIRLNNNKIKNDDQKRTLSPREAVKLGADYIVIGRPVLNSKNPKKVIELINEQTR